ncbi:hypothetical protein PC110_g14448 [Phytophthora cactorum]|uniref:Uncharacterized protein n=1 Tax=Phytophthora cactorum TaxID=29920 RepID=A0A329RXA2_9STRA|nr:hypothetical protein PC114_g10376 [Phytophthora cactorum]KAG2947998.1 hypothetical protein PC117_g6347 [Phytophthora cactorum]KAG3170519.1 hypothetical protein C6341_g10775 [Phytophthora cactorum]RAW29194.1 hypothetical protein PC110_g14448 [Phytophthora cactorum]
MDFGPISTSLRHYPTLGSLASSANRYTTLQSYLPKDKVVETTQHVRNIATLDKEQNENVQRLYLEDDTAEAHGVAQDTGGPSADGEEGTSAGTVNGRAKRRGRGADASAEDGKGDESAVQEEIVTGVVNNVVGVDLMNYREAIRSRLREKWIKAMAEGLRGHEENGV